VRDIYLGMWPATQVNSAWPSVRGWAQWVSAKERWRHKTVWSHCYTLDISERFRDKGLI